MVRDGKYTHPSPWQSIQCKDLFHLIPVAPGWRVRYHYRPQPSCRKVMFSQASVILFTGEGACMVGVACVAGGVHGMGCVCQGVCMAGEIATAAGGIHPTGMHSCCHEFYTNEGSKPKNSREQLRSTSSQYLVELRHFSLTGVVPYGRVYII